MPSLSAQVNQRLQAFNLPVTAHSLSKRSRAFINTHPTEEPLLALALCAVSIASWRLPKRGLSAADALSALHLSLRAETTQGQLQQDRAACNDPEQQTQFILTAADAILQWHQQPDKPTEFHYHAAGTEAPEELPLTRAFSRDFPLWAQISALTPASRLLSRAAELLVTHPDAATHHVHANRRHKIYIQGLQEHLDLPVIPEPDQDLAPERSGTLITVNCGHLNVPVLLARALFPEHRAVQELAVIQTELMNAVHHADRQLHRVTLTSRETTEVPAC